MGTTLTGKIVAETYDSLLKVTDNNVITGTKKRLTDGFGNDTPLLLSSTDVQIDGNFLLPGTTLQYVRGDGSIATFPTFLSADKLITEVYNNSGATITKGTIIYINGTQGNLPTIAKALATGDSTSAQTFGFVQSDITNMNNGYVIVAGKLSDLDTSAYTGGTQLYLSPTTAGTYTSTKQYAPNHLVYVGIVVRAHPTQGIIEVKIQNGYELDELHDVSAQSPSNNDGIFFNTSTSLWEKKSVAAALGFTPVPTTRTISTTSPLSGGGDLSANRTLTIAQATTSTDGYLSSTDWTTFNSKIGGSGTTNTLPKFTGTSALGNSNISDSGTLISLGSNTTISSGSLGIGSTALTDSALRISKPITGSTTPAGIQITAAIQNDATSSAIMFQSTPSQAAGGTLTSLYHFSASQSTISGTITNQVGYHVFASLTSATNNFGFRGQIASGTNRWNLYMDGTADNYIAGSLGIGSTTLTGVNLRIAKTLTGSTTARAAYITSTIQSDVTANAIYFSTDAATQATAFTLASLVHYQAGVASFGAGSSVTTQTGFNVNSSLTGATTNYGFRSQLASATGRWNLYLDGTASNYLNGTTLIGSTTDNGTTAKLQVTGGISYQNIFNRQTASYTLVLTDQGKIVETNVATANNLTIPLNSSVAFPIGTEIQVLQLGAGQTTIVATSGVTTRSKSGQLKIANQYTGVTLVKVGTDEWYVIGNLTA